MAHRRIPFSAVCEVRGLGGCAGQGDGGSVSGEGGAGDGGDDGGLGSASSVVEETPAHSATVV